MRHLISTQTAALLTGKAMRTVQHWVAEGGVENVTVERRRAGIERDRSLVSLEDLSNRIPIALTPERIEAIMQANAGEVDAMLRVGLEFFAEQEQKIAAEWFHLAAKKGQVDAMEWLSICYLNGLGFAEDPAEGLQWLSKAAALGHPVARVKLQAMGFAL